MTPVNQLVLHDPANGQYGDCMRACVASLLNLPAKEVPHFYANGDDTEFAKELNIFLRQQGLVELNLKYRKDFFKPEYVFRGQKDIYHIIVGKTSGGLWHAVVGRDGQLVHDPGPDKRGLAEPLYLTFLVACPRGIPL